MLRVYFDLKMWKWHLNADYQVIGGGGLHPEYPATVFHSSIQSAEIQSLGDGCFFCSFNQSTDDLPLLKRTEKEKTSVQDSTRAAGTKWRLEK